MERSRYRWTTLAVMAIFIMICITIVVYHYQTKEKILKKAATDAQEAEKRKNDFFESINKDIRRPLNTIINLNKKLNITDKKMPKDKKMEMMDTLRKEAGYLQELVTGVLEISKLESGTYKLKMEDINVYDFCNEIIDMCGEEHIARLSFIPDERDKKRSWRIVSDHARLTAVIKTYIKMALKQTKEDYVCLSYLAMPDSICFIITNTAGKNDIEDKDIIIGMQMAQISSKLLKAKTYIKQDEDGNSYIFEVNEEGQ